MTNAAEEGPPAEAPAQSTGSRTGIVRLVGARVGLLEETEGGTRFTYDPEWVSRPDAASVSLTLPLRREPYTSRGLHPFFENLLPEGWLLEIATQKLKISRDDAFGLLLATAADCIGAVEVLPLAGGGERR
jgi:serine/threonine-protein kinase HipA